MQKALKDLKKFQSLNAEPQSEITKSFTAFCEKMGSVFEIKDFLLSLKAHLPKKFKTGETLLFYESEMLGLRRAYVKNHLFYEESAKNPWPPAKTIALNKARQSLYLASEFGKPFPKLLPFPSLWKTGAGRREKNPPFCLWK